MKSQDSTLLLVPLLRRLLVGEKVTKRKLPNLSRKMVNGFYIQAIIKQLQLPEDSVVVTQIFKIGREKVNSRLSPAYEAVLRGGRFLMLMPPKSSFDTEVGISKMHSLKLITNVDLIFIPRLQPPLTAQISLMSNVPAPNPPSLGCGIGVVRAA